MLPSKAKASYSSHAGSPFVSVVGNMMLHHPATFPMGAIAPVSFLWRPLPNPSSDPDVRRQLWVWVHPSASAELLQAFHKVAPQHEGKVALVAFMCLVNAFLLTTSFFYISNRLNSHLDFA